MAAFANGAMSHVLDYDDIVTEAYCHPTSPTLSAALAVAERVGRVTGKEFITAMTLGIDLIIRMSLAVVQSSEGFKHDWHLTPLFGTFSSTAVAGRLLGLDANKMADAFGIAFLQAAGSFQMAWSVGAEIASHRDGFPAKAGVLSTLLADRGITGIKDCLESRAGLYNLYFKGGYDPSFLTDGLGERFEGSRMGFKAFPTCACIPTYITATLDIVWEHDIRPEDIAEITMSVNDFAQKLCEPLEERRKPPDRMSATLSLPFTVAAAAAHRKVDIGTFDADYLNDPDILDVAQKVMTKFDSELNSPGDVGARPAVVEIRTRSGDTHVKRVDFPYGHSSNPMTTDDLVKKFKDCVSHAAMPIRASNVEKAIDLLMNLEKVDDMSRVIGLFV